MNKSHLLINEPALQVLPSLAKAIGLDEAIVIQQLHYWLNNTKSEGRVDENGEKWVYNTYAEWQEDNFPFWSEDKIKRIFLKLEEQKVVISRQLDAKMRDMTKFYRIDYDVLCTMDGAILPLSNSANLHDVKMNQRIPENTISGIEASIWQGRPTVESDMPENTLDTPALDAFQSALQTPMNWNWYPAKSTEEKTWRDFRTYLISLYDSDPNCFSKYQTWRTQPYARGAMSNLAIKRNPENFPASWSDFLASSSMYGETKSKAFAL
jgi:hypothetical protein